MQGVISCKPDKHTGAPRWLPKHPYAIMMVDLVVKHSEEFFFFFLSVCYFTEAKETEWEVKITNQESSQSAGSGNRYAGLHFREQDGQTGERI